MGTIDNSHDDNQRSRFEKNRKTIMILDGVLQRIIERNIATRNKKNYNLVSWIEETLDLPRYSQIHSSRSKSLDKASLLKTTWALRRNCGDDSGVPGSRYYRAVVLSAFN